MGTPTYHSSSSLLSFLCPYTHMSLQLLTALPPLSAQPSTHRSSRQHLNHSLTPSLSTANNENGPRQAELHEGSHAQQLCQPANGRADWTAGDLYIRRPSNQRKAVRRKAVHSEEGNCQQHSKKELLQGRRETAHNARLPGHAAS